MVVLIVLFRAIEALIKLPLYVHRDYCNRCRSRGGFNHSMTILICILYSKNIILIQFQAHHHLNSHYIACFSFRCGDTLLFVSFLYFCVSSFFAQYHLIYLHHGMLSTLCNDFYTAEFLAHAC